MGEVITGFIIIFVLICIALDSISPHKEEED